MSRPKSKKIKNNVEKPEVTKEELLRSQQLHLIYLEQLGLILPRFRNTSVVQALNYELIQVLNNYLLGEILQ